MTTTSEMDAQGRMTAGVRWAITWLHERAREMNDGHAQQVLHSAATNLGWDWKESRSRLNEKEG